MRPSHAPISSTPAEPGSRHGGHLRRSRGARLQRAALLIPGLMLAACTHDWAAYDPRVDSGSGGAGGAGGAGTSGTGTGGTGGSGSGLGGAGGSGLGGAGGAGGSSCEDGLTRCDGSCVDPDVDPDHCGECRNACPSDQECIAGDCVIVCGVGLTNCGGSCVDTDVDQGHCGDCDAACATGDVCVDGDCVCRAPVCGLCGVQDLGSAVPQTINGGTLAAPDNVDLGCVPPGAGEMVFAFTAPLSGPYSLDTFGSGYDVALGVIDIDEGCSEVECDDDTLGTDSQIVMDLDQDQTVLVVVDGFEGSEGSFALHIQSAVCPLASLGSNLPEMTGGATDGLGNILSPSCGDPGSPEATYGFVAPADGMYTFDTIGSSFDTVLHIHDGGCFGPELGCDDDTVDEQSVVTLALAAGQAVVIVVDGFGGDAGDYTLNVN